MLSAHFLRNASVLALIATLGSTGGCSSEPVASPAVAPILSSAATAADIERVLSAYEEARVALARDDMASAVASATAIEKASSEAAASSPEGPRLQRIASAAQKMKSAPTSAPDEVRRAFGGVSEGVVELVAADTALRAKLHVFECPMAQGYKKWVQMDEKVANPYMGTEMIECGSKAAW